MKSTTTRRESAENNNKFTYILTGSTFTITRTLATALLTVASGLLSAQFSFAQDSCPDGSDPVISQVGSSWNRNYVGPLYHMRQPKVAAAGHTGAGTSVVMLEQHAPAWFFEHHDGRGRPFGAGVKPEDAAPDHWGWVPETDPSYPDEPCKIGWVMCIAADTDAFATPIAEDQYGAPAGLSKCKAFVDSYKSETGTIGSKYSGGHATNTALGISSVAPDAKIIAISLPRNSGREAASYRAAFRWLYSKGWAYSAGTEPVNNRLYLDSDDATAWKRYWWKQFGTSTPIDRFNVVATNVSYLVSSDVYNEACEIINPAIDQTNSDGDILPDIDDNCTEVDNVVRKNIGTGAEPVWVNEQPDGDNDGYGNACDGDLDNDNDFDWSDISMFIDIRDNFADFIPPEDLNKDGNYNDDDKLMYKDAADFDRDGDVDKADTQYLSQNLWHNPGPSYVDIVGQYDSVRKPYKYVQDRLYLERGAGNQWRARHRSFDQEFKKLREKGVVSIFSAANDGYTNGLPLPACHEDSIAVTGLIHNADRDIYNNYSPYTGMLVDKASIKTSSSPTMPVIVAHSLGDNWAPLDPSTPRGVKAPGCYLDPYQMDGGNGSWSTPTVAGAVAVLRSDGVAPDATPEEIEFRLWNTQRRGYVHRDCTLPGPDQAPYDPDNYDIWCDNSVSPEPAADKVVKYSRSVIDLASAVEYGPNSGESDKDNDGIFDKFDNCVWVKNPNQRDSDGDLYGDSCDADYNQDGMVDNADVDIFVTQYLDTERSHGDFNSSGRTDSTDYNRLLTRLLNKKPGPSGLDTDRDGVGNHLDNCVTISNGPWTPNPLGLTKGRYVQFDQDRDRFGNVCDGDINNDGIMNVADRELMQTMIANKDRPVTLDLNNDGKVNTNDVEYFNTNLLKDPPVQPGASGLCRWSSLPSLDCENQPDL